MTIQTSLPLILALISSGTSYAEWTETRTEEFEELSFGSSLANTDWYKTNRPTDTKKNQLITDEMGGTTEAGILLPANSAGEGNALYFFDNSTDGLARAGLDLSESGQNVEVCLVKFDFSFVSVDPDSQKGFGVLGLTESGNKSFGNPDSRSISVNLKEDGSLSWAGGTVLVSDPTSSHKLAILANGSPKELEYAALDGSGATQLPPKTFDLYLDGKRVAQSIPFTTNSIPLGRFGVTTYSATTGVSFLIDNLSCFTAQP
tara:strand:- start:58577 stop:59356 length:780 start_codon:yes stop_codon:yes gene_type:complete